MSKYLAPLSEYEQVRAERRKLKGKSQPRASRMTVALAEKDMPASVVKDIQAAQLRRRMFEQAQSANWNPCEIFRGKPL
jgi:hypothetical protein